MAEKTMSELQQENLMLKKALTEAFNEVSALYQRISNALEAVQALSEDETDELPAAEDSLWLSDYETEPDEFYDPDFYDYLFRYDDLCREPEYESEEDFARGEGFYIDDDGNWIPRGDYDDWF